MIPFGEKNNLQFFQSASSENMDSLENNFTKLSRKVDGCSEEGYNS